MQKIIFFILTIFIFETYGKDYFLTPVKSNAKVPRNGVEVVPLKSFGPGHPQNVKIIAIPKNEVNTDIEMLTNHNGQPLMARSTGNNYGDLQTEDQMIFRPKTAYSTTNAAQTMSDVTHPRAAQFYQSADSVAYQYPIGNGWNNPWGANGYYYEGYGYPIYYYPYRYYYWSTNRFGPGVWTYYGRY